MTRCTVRGERPLRSPRKLASGGSAAVCAASNVYSPPRPTHLLLLLPPRYGHQAQRDVPRRRRRKQRVARRRRAHRIRASQRIPTPHEASAIPPGSRHVAWCDFVRVPPPVRTRKNLAKVNAVRMLLTARVGNALLGGRLAHKIFASELVPRLSGGGAAPMCQCGGAPRDVPLDDPSIGPYEEGDCARGA